jgi:farnesyl diphosphate synthase
MKTGALLRYACVAGAILGKATPKQRAAVDRYGTLLGQAFQIADDLLDLEGDPETVGKQTGKDAAAHKATLVSLLGPDQARVKLKQFVKQAQDSLAGFGKRADVLKTAARFVAERQA